MHGDFGVTTLRWHYSDWSQIPAMFVPTLTRVYLVIPCSVVREPVTGSSDAPLSEPQYLMTDAAACGNVCDTFPHTNPPGDRSRVAGSL